MKTAQCLYGQSEQSIIQNIGKQAKFTSKGVQRSSYLVTVTI